MYSSCSGCYSAQMSSGSYSLASNINYASNTMYSLEARVADGEVPSASFERRTHYAASWRYHAQALYHHNYSNQTSHTYHAVDVFLKPHRPEVQFIDTAEQIEQYVRQTFSLTTGNELPTTMQIHVVPKETLKEIHELNGGVWSDGILGFSMNTNGHGTDLIFVKENDLDRLMLVVGHEIGHVVSKTLGSKLNEEAKAFAFEMAWMKAIVEHNIAGLRDNITLDVAPAQNGLHDVAFLFVKKCMQRGKEALQIYGELVRGLISAYNI